MRRKQRALLYVSYVLMSRWAYLCQNPKDKRLTRSLVNLSTRWLLLLSTRQLVLLSTRLLVHSLTSQLVNFPTCQLVLLSTRPLVTIVIFLVRILTLWVLFLPPIVHLVAKNRFSRRFVLMQIKGSCTYGQNEYLLNKSAVCTSFWPIFCYIQCILPLNAARFGAKRNAFWC